MKKQTIETRTPTVKQPTPERRQKPKTSAQRFNKHSDGKKAAGLVRLPTRWVHPDDKKSVLDFIEQKNKARSIT